MGKSSAKSGQAESKKKAPGKNARKEGKTTKQIMTRQISDKNAVITDEEFKNLDIDVEGATDSKHQPLQIPDNPDRPKDEDKDHNIVTPWDVIK